MGKYAFVKLKQDPGEPVELDIKKLPSIPNGLHWERFGSNLRGWDLAYFPYPDYIKADSIKWVEVNTDSLSKTLGKFSTGDKSKMLTWLTDNGYSNTMAITNTKTVQEVFGDVLYYLDGYRGNKKDLIKFVKRIGK